METQSIRLAISKDEFIRNFNQSILKWTLTNSINYYSESIFVGKVEGNEFNYSFKNANFNNALTTVIRGKIEENSDNNCTLRIWYSKLRFTQIFLSLWASQMFLLGLAFLIAPTFYCLIPFAMSFIGFAGLKIKPKKSKERLLNQLLKICQLEQTEM